MAINLENEGEALALRVKSKTPSDYQEVQTA